MEPEVKEKFDMLSPQERAFMAGFHAGIAIEGLVVSRLHGIKVKFSWSEAIANVMHECDVQLDSEVAQEFRLLLASYLKAEMKNRK